MVEEEVELNISSVAFDKTGEYLAVGYTDGTIHILNQSHQNDDSSANNQENNKNSDDDEEEGFQGYLEFVSHENEFDFLTSSNISPGIKNVEWYPFQPSGFRFLLSANEKTLKLFKINANHNAKQNKLVTHKKTFQGAHAYNVHSIGFNSDGETFISADDLRILLWNLNVSSETFTIVDMKPENMEDLTEVITCTSFHPNQCNLMVYSTSTGVLRVSDLRKGALCDNSAKEFIPPDDDTGGFFKELVVTISDAKFSPCGNFIAARDYLTMKIWDVRKEDKVLKSISFHDHLIPKLCDLYENESIFDKFELCWNNDPKNYRLLTGSYDNNFYLCDVFGDQPQIQTIRASQNGNENPVQELCDSKEKILHVDYNPVKDLLVLGGRDGGYIFHKENLINIIHNSNGELQSDDEEEDEEDTES